MHVVRVGLAAIGVAEDARVQHGEVREVERVLHLARRLALDGERGATVHVVRGIARMRQRRDVSGLRPRRREAHPHEPGSLAHLVCLDTRLRRDRPVGELRDERARAVLAVLPTVVRATHATRGRHRTQ